MRINFIMYNLVFPLISFCRNGTYNTCHQQKPNLIETFFTLNYSPANTYLCLQEHFGDSIKQIKFGLKYP